MPILITLRMRLPVWPVQAPVRTLSEKAAIRSRTAWTSGPTSLPSIKICSPRGALSATCPTARCSLTLIFSPANILSRNCVTPRASARASKSRIVSSVTRFFE